MQETYIRIALNEAKKALKKGEVPIGAVIVDPSKKKIISYAHNLVESKQNPTFHAEVIAINKAVKVMGNKFLNNCEIYVTLEPCPMCAMAISLAHIKAVYFCAYSPKTGSIDNGPMLYNNSVCNHKPEVYGGIHEEKSSRILREFFEKKL